MMILKKLKNYYKLILASIFTLPYSMAYSDFLTVNNDLQTVILLSVFSIIFIYLMMYKEDYSVFAIIGLIFIGFMFLQINIIIGVILFCLAAIGAFKEK